MGRQGLGSRRQKNCCVPCGDSVGPTKYQGNLPERPGWLRAEALVVRGGLDELGECPNTVELVSTRWSWWPQSVSLGNPMVQRVKAWPWRDCLQWSWMINHPPCPEEEKREWCSLEPSEGHRVGGGCPVRTVAVGERSYCLNLQWSRREQERHILQLFSPHTFPFLKNSSHWPDPSRSHKIRKCRQKSVNRPWGENGE